MYVLVTYRDEDNQMKNEGARVVTTLYSYILDAQGQLTLQLVDGRGGQTPSNSYGSPCYLQMRKIHSKVKVLEWSQQISHCKSMQIFMMLKGS